MSREDELKKDFRKILDRWKEALDQPETELSRDAAILRFELTFEVGWKYIQLRAREEGYEVNSARLFNKLFQWGGCRMK